MVQQNLKVTRGDTTPFQYKATANGGAFNLTGATIKLTIKVNKTDADPGVLQLTTSSGIAIDDAAGGMATITVPATAPFFSAITQDTQYVYDIQITTAGGQVYTTQEGTFLVEMDVTAT